MENRMRALGLDVGSTTIKIAGVDSEGNLLWHQLEPVAANVEAQIERFILKAHQVVKNVEILPLVATGYGRDLVHQADRKVTEITCHAGGVYREFHHGGTLVDIGGQDSKVIVITPQSCVIDFIMSDKCAACTGRFLENTARRLGVPLAEMGQRALSATSEVSISSTCTVFAGSEVISLIAQGMPLDSILRGLHRSLVRRLVSMIHTVRLFPPLMLSGGVASNQAIRKMIEEETGTPVILPANPQLTGAYGAALIALTIPSIEEINHLR